MSPFTFSHWQLADLSSSIWSCFLGFPSIASVRNELLTSLPFIISKVRISKMTNGTHFFETKLQNAKILPPGRLFKHRWQNHVHIPFGRYNDEFGKAGSVLTSWQLRWCSGTRGTNWDIRSWASFIKKKYTVQLYDKARPLRQKCWSPSFPWRRLCFAECRRFLCCTQLMAGRPWLIIDRGALLLTLGTPFNISERHRTQQCNTMHHNTTERT